jgi:hypothetical protein
MKDSEEPDLPAKSQFLVYAAEDGRVKVEVRLENETVWLTQQHMAELFQTTQQNISLHLQNIYEEGELQRAATHKEFLSVHPHQTIAAIVQAEKGRQEVKSRPAIPGATAHCLPSPAGRGAGNGGAQHARDLLLPHLLSGQVAFNGKET